LAGTTKLKANSGLQALYQCVERYALHYVIGTYWATGWSPGSSRLSYKKMIAQKRKDWHEVFDDACAWNHPWILDNVVCQNIRILPTTMAIFFDHAAGLWNFVHHNGRCGSMAWNGHRHPSRIESMPTQRF